MLTVRSGVHGETIFTLTLLLAAFLPGPGPARAQEALQQRLRDFRVGDHWIYDDWERARKLAATTGRPIFAVFRCVP